MEKEKQKRVEEAATPTTPVQSIETTSSISDESFLDKFIKLLRKQSEEIKDIQEKCYRSKIELEVIRKFAESFNVEGSVLDNEGRFKQPKLYTDMTQDPFVRGLEYGI